MRPIFVILMTAPSTVIMGTFAILTCFLPLEVGSFWARWWARGILWAAGVKVNVTGMENVDPKKPSIYMPNHASMIDIPVLLALLPVNLRFIYKQVLNWVPFLGWAIYLIGMVPIDRSNLEKARTSLRKAGERVRKRGTHLLIFPEGTRTRDNRLKGFKKGGFYLAIGESIDVVPISINGSQAIGGRDSIWIKSGTIDLEIHPRIDMTHHTIENRAAALEEVRTAIVSGLRPEHRPAT